MVLSIGLLFAPKYDTCFSAVVQAKEAPPFVKKKATLAMLRLLREGQVELQDLSGRSLV